MGREGAKPLPQGGFAREQARIKTLIPRGGVRTSRNLPIQLQGDVVLLTSGWVQDVKTWRNIVWLFRVVRLDNLLPNMFFPRALDDM